MHSRNSLFNEITQYSGNGLESRAESSLNVGVKFLQLLRKEVGDDDKAFDLMMKAWFRAIKDNDFSKFRRTYRKYTDKADQQK